MLTHYQTLAHPQLLAPLPEAEAFINSLSSEEIAHLLSTYPSLLAMDASTLEREEDEEGKENDPRQEDEPMDHEGGCTIQEKLCTVVRSHWLTQLILPPVLKWLLTLFEHVSIRPMPSTVSAVGKLNILCSQSIFVWIYNLGG